MEDDEPKIKDDDDIAEELDSSTIEEDDKNIELDISKEV